MATEPSAELVVLLQRAAGHLVKVIGRADDSDGMIGDLARRVLDLHREACTAGAADPQKLARGVGPLSFGEFPSFAAKYAAERLAVIDRDVDLLVELLGGDLSSPYQFVRVVEAMVELGEVDAALEWARRGIAGTNGWQVGKLYDLAADLLAADGDLGGVVELRRDHHQRMPSSSTYARLQAAAGAADTWGAEVASARAALADRGPAGLIDALLADDEPNQAWNTATAMDRDLDGSQWLRLAEAREPTAPGDSMAVYLRLADGALERADKRAYRNAVRHRKAARRAATAADRLDEFTERLADLRERNRRRPSLMAMLDKAGLE